MRQCYSKAGDKSEYRREGGTDKPVASTDIMFA